MGVMGDTMMVLDTSYAESKVWQVVEVDEDLNVSPRRT